MNEKDLQLWKDYVEASSNLMDAKRNLIQGATDKIEIIRVGMYSPSGAERDVALGLLRTLQTDELQMLLTELLAFAISQNGWTPIAQDFIFSLPKEWLLENLEAYSEPILANNDYDEYRQLIHLYSQISVDLAEKLAKRATAHHDPDIRKEGETFLVDQLPRLGETN